MVIRFGELHSLDRARHFKAEECKEPGQVLLTPGEPAPDLQQFIAKEEEKNTPTNRSMRLSAWGMMQFRREALSTDVFPDWHDALREAQVILEQRSLGVDEVSFAKSGPCFVAAYLIRDHYTELTPSELEWCRELVIDTVLRKDAERSFDTRISKNPLDGSRPCALVLPLLLKNAPDYKTRSRVEECLAAAMTHTSEEVRDYAAEGVRSWLWNIDPNFAKACVGGLCELANAENQIRQVQRRLEKFSREGEENTLMAATTEIRARIVKRNTFTALNTPVIDLETHDWPELLDALSMIEPTTKDTDLSVLVMACLTAVLREAQADEAWKSDHRGNVSYEFLSAFATLFARFALARPVAEAEQIGQLMCDYIERCPKYLGELLEALPYEEDRVHSGEAFWIIWKSVARPIFEHTLLLGPRIWRYDELRKLVRILLFADIKWNDHVREWTPLTDNRHFIESAVSVVGNTPVGFGALVSFLSSAVGQVFLPDIIRLLANSVGEAKGQANFNDINAQFDIEVLLRKACYSFGGVIRQRPDLHRAVILLLDMLVERGSHTAFRLRDYIISPLPTGD